jgi:hypothetical protein
MIKKLIELWRGCNKCDHSDNCKSTELARDLMPPLSRRRAKPVCFGCNHAYQNIERSLKRSTCHGCGAVSEFGVTIKCE